MYTEQIYNVSCLGGVFAEKYLSRESRCTCIHLYVPMAMASLCLQNNKGDFWLFINDDQHLCHFKKNKHVMWYKWLNFIT